jgi:hypothetical protein
MGSFIICSYPQISSGRSDQKNEVCGAYGTHGRREKVYKALVGKLEGNRLLGPRHRWEDGIKMNIREIGWEGCGVD